MNPLIFIIAKFYIISLAEGNLLLVYKLSIRFVLLNFDIILIGKNIGVV